MSTESRIPLILAFIENLFFTAKIEKTAELLNCRVESIENHQMFASEPQELIESILDLQPSLVVFDLNSQKIPAIDWILKIKSDPRTHPISVIAFGPHIKPEELKSARRAGADEVLPQGKFVEKLPEFINKYALKIEK